MIQVLKKAFDILEFIAQDPERPRGLGEISRKSGINQATCAHIVKTMVNCNYLEQLAPKKGYILGPMAYYIARNGQYRKDLVRIAEPYLMKLAEELQETVLISTLKQNKKFVLYQIEGSQALQIRSDLLPFDDVYQTATGRLLLANASTEELNLFIMQKGLPGDVWPEIEGMDSLKAELKKIRKDGTVIVTSKPQIVQLAFPITEDGRVIAALGIFLPEFRFTGSHKQSIVVKAKDAVKAINSKLSDQ